MAQSLMINGITVNVQDGAAGLEVVEQGERTRAFDGTARSSIRSKYKKWSFKMPLQAGVDANSFRNLINGDFHTCSFNDATGYTSRGLAPSAVTNVTYTNSAPVKFGSRKMLVGATTGTVSWAAQLGLYNGAYSTNYVVAVWRYNGASWDHYVIFGNGNVYTNGVLTGAAAWLTVASGTVTIANTTGSVVSYDDLMMMNGTIPTDWPLAWYTWNRPQSSAPLLSVNGDIMVNPLGTGTDLVMLGQAITTEIQQGAPSGTWSGNLQTLNFSLEEV